MLIKELETRVSRTYRGGALLDEFLGREPGADTFYPEDWISSFLEAKNQNYIPGEGISRVEDGGLITQAVGEDAFGSGRRETGVLIKLLDSAERLGIQVHPTDAMAQKLFGSTYGKTECWHILATRTINGETPKVYLGFQPQVTRQMWEDWYRRQDVAGMLSGMHGIDVKPGDTILVQGGTPHAIGGGCLILEIQQPSDYTMRCETTALSGQKYTPQQIHYGAGEQAMLDCFTYAPMTEEQLRQKFLLPAVTTRGEGWVRKDLVTYAHTPCFALAKMEGDFRLEEPVAITLLALESGGEVTCQGKTYPLKRGDRFLATAGSAVTCRRGALLVCYPPNEPTAST